MHCGTVVVLHTVSKPIDLAFKRLRVRVRGRIPESTSICISRECTFFSSSVTTSLSAVWSVRSNADDVTFVQGYWHQRADERHGNPPRM